MIFKQKQKGFTLIELLVVIAIIGVLFAISLPAFRTYERNAQVRIAAKELRSFFWAVQSLSLSPERTDIAQYVATVGSGLSGTLVRENGASEVGTNIVAPWKPQGPIIVSKITADTNDGLPVIINNASVNFGTGNADGGRMTISSGSTNYNNLIVEISSAVSPLVYEVVLDAGSNTVDMRKRN